jgi:phosphopantetheinyl transferase
MASSARFRIKSNHPVDIRTISLTASHPVVLSADEAERAGRFHFARDRERWSRAHSALRAILSGYLGVAALDLRFAIGRQGKPFLPEHSGVEFNLSHSGDYALVAIARGVPVGVDIQEIRPQADMAVLLRRLSESDLPAGTAELYSRWVRREARSKAAGGALFDPPSPEIYAEDLEAPEGYAAAVALRGFTPLPVYFSSL